MIKKIKKNILQRRLKYGSCKYKYEYIYCSRVQVSHTL